MNNVNQDAFSRNRRISRREREREREREHRFSFIRLIPNYICEHVRPRTLCGRFVLIWCLHSRLIWLSAAHFNPNSLQMQSMYGSTFSRSSRDVAFFCKRPDDARLRWTRFHKVHMVKFMQLLWSGQDAYLSEWPGTSVITSTCTALCVITV